MKILRALYNLITKSKEPPPKMKEACSSCGSFTPHAKDGNWCRDAYAYKKKQFQIEQMKNAGMWE